MGSSTTVQQPAPPVTPQSSMQTAEDALNAQINAAPRILETQKQLAPGYSQLELDQLLNFAPQYADAALKLQQEYAPQFAEIERGLSPELAGAQQTLSNFLSQTDEQEYQSLRPGLLDDVRAAQSQRGLGAISPLGSIDEGVQLQRLKQSLKDRRLNIALSTAGRVPISSFPTVQGQSGSPGQLVQNVNPDSIFGYQQGLNNFNASVFGTQAGMYNNSQANQSNVFGTILGYGVGAATGGFGTGIGTRIGNNLFKQ